MKLQITKEDISFLIGKFVIELNNDFEEKIRKDNKYKKSHESIASNIDFYIEKRISFVGETEVTWDDEDDTKTEVKYSLNGFGYNHGTYNEDEFVEKFNKPTESRYMRLMTSKELDVLFDYMKKNVY